MKRYQPTYQIGLREELPSLFNLLGFCGNGIEIGVFKGEFSEKILSKWKDGRLYLLDRWRSEDGYLDYANTVDHDENFNLVKQKFGENDRVTIIKLDSMAASYLFADGFFDWIYHDADHSYDGLMPDLHAWYPKLKVGGIYAGHDYLDEHNNCGLFEVKRAVDEFAKGHNVDLRVTKELQWKSWYFIKR